MSADNFFCVSDNKQAKDVQNDGKSVKRINIIRLEHPNCAIYKKTISTIDEDIIRTTLFTPSKRISKDVSKLDNQIRRNYVSSESHLETLLVYLKDIKVSTNDTEILSAIAEQDTDTVYVGQMLATPYTQILEKWISQEDYQVLCKTKTFASCIYQMQKILKAQIECVSQAAQKYDIRYFTFEDVIKPMDADRFEKYYYKYYRQASKEYAHLQMLVKIANPIEDYHDILNRKHIKGVIATADLG